MNIVIVGHVCIDHNVSEGATYTTAGSPAMFMAKIFRQLPDTQVTIVSHYGEDFLPFAKEITLFPTIPTGALTLIYENVSRGNERSQKALHRDAAIPVPMSSELQSILSAADILIFGPILPNFSPEFIKEIISAANPKAVKLLLPQGYFRDFDGEDRVIFRTFAEAQELIGLVDFMTISVEDYPDIESLARIWARKNSSGIIMTKGDAGAVIITASGEKEIPTDPIPVAQIVDSVGSGDIFSAGFIYEYMVTKNVEKAVTFANKLAGVCLAYTPDKITFDYTALQ